MSLVHYYDSVQDFERLLEDAITARFPPAWVVGTPRESGGRKETAFRPKMDVHEDAKNNTVIATFELPGLKKEDVSIDLQNNRLTVSGEVQTSSEHDEKGFAVRERSYGSFCRNLQVPNGLKPDQIKASMENGVLNVTFPKTTQHQQPKKITVT